MDKTALSNWIFGYLPGESMYTKDQLTAFLWEKIRVALDEAESTGYWRGYEAGRRDESEFTG